MPSEQPQYLYKYRQVPGIDDIDVYLKHEGYNAVRKALTMDQEAIINEVKLSGLRGRGGAGFPTFIKWNGIPKNWDKPHYLVVNADEGEPGTAKDRDLMNALPHLLVEGCIISCWAIRSKACYIYIRGEYIQPARQIQKAIDQAYAKGFLGKNILGSGFDLDMYVHMGAGAYECGEESALMSSLMGERGMPRHKPPSAPLPVISGVWDSPTIVNNVETIATAVPIINMGGAEYAKVGTGTPGAGPASRGTKLITLSGHVKKPGNYEIVLGTPVREIIYEIGGGIKNDKKLKFFIPGGSSTPLLPPEFLDTPYDYEALGKTGSLLGSGALIVYDETVSVPALMTRLMHFYAHESCGKCTPCREGTNWLVKIHDRIMAGGGRPEDIDLLLDISNNIFGRSFCALGDAAAMPLAGFFAGKGAIYYFREEYEELIRNGAGGKKRAFAPLQMAGV
ncbi:NADH-quinone oxidoreductase subunit F [Capsulimonas corticalis]|uniref:NADH-quinone oxidoreductase subunit F n=1 Tax=Capsulimonas corticalis TaxID=2219043 RepID=A0A402CYG4_9BACT|nr:NADH-quinone oxidoreductase subunit NuoF [Capsulimonas corticalis]BDI31360.1 NADH-quinone oxidoreductase subunit F [Capsulimonas corticalis]